MILAFCKKRKNFRKGFYLKKSGSDEVSEAFIAEISPSGKYMRLEVCFPELPGTLCDGRWLSTETYSVAEELPRR